MIELEIKSNNGITKTVINVQYIRWIDLLIDSKELFIWVVGNEAPLIFSDDILVNINILDIYKRLKLLMMK